MAEINDNEYLSLVGVDQVFIAEILEDTSGNYSADTPEYLAPAVGISVKPKTSQDTQYADNRAFDVLTSEAESDIELELTNCPLEITAKLLGKPFDATTGRLIGMPAIPGYFAVGYRAKKSNGKYRYHWLHKVQFSVPENDAKTQTEKMDPQTMKLQGKAIKTTHPWTMGSRTDGIKDIEADEDNASFTSATDWFTEVQVPDTGSVSALVLSSSSPADNAISVAVGANITLTYNNKLQTASINSVVLLTDGANIASAVSLSDTKKIVTVNPSANLSASTEYTLVANVTDIYGQNLTSIITFTTASA